MTNYRILAAAAPLLCCLCVVSPGIKAVAQAAAPKPASVEDSAQQLLEKDKALKRKIHLWEWTLSQIAKRENATMFVDLALDRQPPDIAYNEPHGAATMRALANASDREWKQASGIQTFRRTPMRKSTEQVTAALTWLTQLPDDEFKRLVDGKCVISNLDPQAQELMLGFAGWEPDLNFSLLGRSDTTQVHLIVGPTIRFVDSKTGLTRVVTMPCHPNRVQMATPAANHAQTLTPLDHPDLGALKFGAGEVLTLAETAKRADEAFHVTYIVDARIADNHYFLSGNYNQKSFEAALGQVATVPPVRLKQEKPDRTADLALIRARMLEANAGKVDFTRLRDFIRVSGSEELARLNQRYGESEEVDASSFLQQKSMTAADFCQGRPGIAQLLQSEGIPPGTMLTLDADIGFAILGDGLHLASNATAAIGGQAVPAYGQNEVLVGLK